MERVQAVKVHIHSCSEVPLITFPWYWNVALVLKLVSSFPPVPLSAPFCNTNHGFKSCEEASKTRFVVLLLLLAPIAVPVSAVLHVFSLDTALKGVDRCCYCQS